MAKRFNKNLIETLALTREMLALADEGDRDREDPSCGIIYGILRDSAYRIRKLAQEECDNHQRKGKWDAELSCPAVPEKAREP